MAAWEFHKLELRIGGIWRDLTTRVDPDTPISVEIAKRGESATALDEADASTMRWGFVNSDHALTPGNPLSPYYPDLEPAVEVRLTETIDGIPYELFVGDAEFPEIENYVIADAAAPRSQVIAMSAVDRTARLDRSRRFLSTLGEHIRYVGGSDLVAFYPLTEPVPRWPDKAGTREPLTLRYTFVGLSAPANELVTPAGGQSAPADDVQVVDLQPRVESGLVVADAFLAVDWAEPLEVDSTTLTLAWWMTWDNAHSDSEAIIRISGLVSVLGTVLTIQLSRLTTGVWRLNASTNDGVDNPAANFDVAGPGADVPTLFAIRVTLPSGLVESWCGSADPVTATMSGATVPSTAYSNQFFIGDRYDGSAGYAQFYLGATYTREVHLAQQAMGWQGLDRQRVDERITTIAEYAGLTTADLSLDEASALMPRARLAGRRAGELIRPAAVTESGVYLATGGGLLELHARARRYNPTVAAATIPVTWLTQPLPIRTDRPINAADVSDSTSGLTTQAINAASVTRYRGEYGTDAGIDTACDADADNLAQWIVDRYGVARMRIAALNFDLIPMTNAQRHTVLTRWISERVDVSGLPANAPEGIGPVHIEGIVHLISPLARTVGWLVSHVLGEIPGVPDVWAEVGTSVVGSSTVIAY